MFVQTQLHLFFKIITISLWSMIIWGSVLLRRTVCGDIDWHWHHQSQLAWPWWWIRSGCRNVSQCHHKHSFSGLHSPGQSYFTNLWYDSWVQTFYKITTGLNFNFHLRPTFTQKALRTAVAVYEFRVTRNCFWAGFLWKSVSFRVILLKIVHKHAGIYSSIIKLLFPGIILWLCWPNIFFFTPTLSNMFAAKDTSQLKMLDGYPEGKYCQYSSQRSLCYEAKKTKQNKTEI